MAPSPRPPSPPNGLGSSRVNQAPRARSAAAPVADGWTLRLSGDDDLTQLQSGRKLGLDLEVEGGPVHRAVGQPRRRQAARAEGRDAGLALPVAKRSPHREAARRSALLRARRVSFRVRRSLGN